MIAGGHRLQVCICTYKRPDLLGHLLETLQLQETRGLFEYAIIVVDNDHAASARDTVERAQTTSPVAVDYEIEPTKNISLARNRALRFGRADYYACLDDDEFAEPTWLLHLYETLHDFAADGVLGPVVPSFPKTPPSWIVQGALFDREAFPTGTVLSHPRQTRSGNFMISRKIVKENPDLFNPDYGLIGGEDSDFFKRMLQKGYRFVWCQEAKAHETVLPARLTRGYQLRRALMRGVAAAKQQPLFSADTARSTAAVMGYTALLPLWFIVRPGRFMPTLIKDCDHLGKLLARVGIRVMRRWPS
jgi:succinoglycan biosynthesis protein ExoM